MENLYLHKPLHTRVYIRAPLKCGLHMVPSFQRLQHGQWGSKIEHHKEKPRKYILGGCWSEFISDIPVDNINPCCVENVTSSLWSSLQKINSTKETFHIILEQFSKTSRSSHKKGSLRDCHGQRSLKETWFSFSSVQSLSRVRVFATPWIAARQASLSITNSWSSLRLRSIELVMPTRHD